MKKQVILFDLDGTIVDSFPGIALCHHYLLPRYGIDPGSLDLTRFVGPPLEHSLEHICGLDEATAQQAVAEYNAYYLEHGALENTLYPGMDRLLRRLREEGHTLLLATSKPQDASEKILAGHGLTSCFHFLAGADLSIGRSEKIDVILHALRGGGVTDRSHAVMVGDRVHDIEGAKAAGLDWISVLYGYGSREEFLQAGTPKDRIAADTGEIYEILHRSPCCKEGVHGKIRHSV